MGHIIHVAFKNWSFPTKHLDLAYLLALVCKGNDSLKSQKQKILKETWCGEKPKSFAGSLFSVFNDIVVFY